MTKAITACACAGALLLAACGGGGGPSKDEYVKKANAICARADAEAQSIVTSTIKDPENPTGEEAQAAIQRLVPSQRKVVADLRALKPPKGDSDKVNAIYSAVDEGIVAYAEAGNDPDSALKLLQGAGSPSDPFTHANQLASGYGLKECAK